MLGGDRIGPSASIFGLELISRARGDGVTGGSGKSGGSGGGGGVVGVLGVLEREVGRWRGMLFVW